MKLLDDDRTLLSPVQVGHARTVLSPSPSPAPELEPDRLLGQSLCGLRFDAVLGQGGMATVYRALHLGTGLSFAVKVLRPALAAHPEVVTRFRAEGATANLVESDHVVRTLEQGLLPSGQPYMVMELLEGETLFESLRRGPPELALARHLLLQICDALGAAHARGIVHRDLKPENVFLVRTAQQRPFVKLMDFGVARVSDAPRLTAHGVVMGTPEYMAPEQCEGRAVDARADLYALAVMAFELTTGRKPFLAKGPLQHMLAHLGQPPPAPRSVVPALPEAWDAVVLRGLAKRPEARFQTAAELASAIRTALPETGDGLPQRKRARQLVNLEGWLAADDAPPRRARVCELSGSGAFVVCPGPAAVGERVQLSLDALCSDGWLDAEVVRVAEQGVAVHFTAAPDALRARLELLLQELRYRCTGARPAVLERFAQAGGASLYALLGLPVDAELASLAAAARTLSAELAAADGCEDERDRRDLAAARKRWSELEPAASSAEARLAYDLRIGNWRGVALGMGSLDGATRARLRAEQLAGRPGLDIQASLYLGRAALAETWGDFAGALKEVETALSLDPLREELHARRAGLLEKIRERG